MALNATLGATDANSYVTQVEADAYFVDRMHSSSWEALDDDVKAGLLITSSQMLDWYVNWKGNKYTVTQSMLWPRTGAIRPDGTEIDNDVLPPEVKVATYEQALTNIEADRMEDDPLSGIGQLRAGSLMIKAGAEKPNQTNANAIPNQIYRILSDLYNQGSGASVVWLNRA
jgi:hypothetical protein